jgi:hypothetical protein
MPLAQEFVESVANSNLKNVADAPAYYSGLAMGNAVAHQQSMQNIQLAAVGKIVKYLTEANAEESMAVLKMMSGNDPASQIANLMAALSSGQQQSKVAGNTPPVTP